MLQSEKGTSRVWVVLCHIAACFPCLQSDNTTTQPVQLSRAACNSKGGWCGWLLQNITEHLLAITSICLLKGKPPPPQALKKSWSSHPLCWDFFFLHYAGHAPSPPPFKIHVQTKIYSQGVRVAVCVCLCGLSKKVQGPLKVTAGVQGIEGNFLYYIRIKQWHWSNLRATCL